MNVFAQQTLQFKLVDSEEKEPISNATILLQSDSIFASEITDSNGLAVFKLFAKGEYTYQVLQLNFYKKKGTIQLDKDSLTTIDLAMDSKEEELDEVIVTTTRSVHKIESLPTQIEVVTSDELVERSLDKPADVSHAVKEQAGIQVQRTSANSGLFNIRLLGMRGKYVQMLKDNFPLFGGLSQNIILTQISPLDLSQVEIIKGPSSTLYGGDAIAGVVNFISKKPVLGNAERDFLVNLESTKSIDVAGYWCERWKWIGVRAVGQYRYQNAKDFNKDNFADIPKMIRYSVSPNLFFYINPNAILQIGCNYVNEKRYGGAMPTIINKPDTAYQYFENNFSERFGHTMQFDYNFESKGRLQIKSASNIFTRKIQLLDFDFSAHQIATQNEINYKYNFKKNEFIVGLDYKSDFYKEQKVDSTYSNNNYKNSTFGLFAQDLFTLNAKTTFEGSLRLDYNLKYKFFALPHIAWLQKWNDIFSTKLNVGMGYKLPSVFQDETEEANFRNIVKIADSLKPERAYGGTLNIAAKAPLGNGFQLTWSEVFFFNHLVSPLVAQSKAQPGYHLISYRNSKGYVQALGLETSLKVTYRGAALQLNYTLQDQNKYDNGKKAIQQYTSKHIVSLLAQYEMVNRFSVGVDAYYYSSPIIANGQTGAAIWELGINGQIITQYVTFFFNIENILDYRQSRFEQIVTPSPTYNSPEFTTIYAPLEGRIFNAGIKVKLGKLKKKGVDND